IFGEDATQLEVFDEIGAVENIKGVLQSGRDGLIATLGVTGSGKSHTILGSKSQRGLTQMSLDILFRSIGMNIRRPYHPELPNDADLIYALQASDPSEAQIMTCKSFLDSTYGDGDRARMSRAQTPMSRAQTPMMVRNPELPGSFPVSPSDPKSPARRLLQGARDSARSFASDHIPSPKHKTRHLSKLKEESPPESREQWHPPSRIPFWQRLTPKKSLAKPYPQEPPMHQSRKAPLPPPSVLPQTPDVSSYSIDVEPGTDYAILVS
ncbi:MAG: hypothetical protein Q9211_007206, partial [Gyalolechia sp. 1 TL-2023]